MVRRLPGPGVRGHLCIYFSAARCLCCSCLTSGTKPATTFQPRAIFCSRGSLIPHSTVSNAHPPLVMAWLALWWKVVGYAPLVTRTAMLVLAAFSLLGVFRLAERVANTKVAIASTLCTALYPVFFAQSSLAQVDLTAAGLTFWALSAYVEGQTAATALWFTLAALTKETAILAPLALAGWEIVGLLAAQEFARNSGWIGDRPRESKTGSRPRRIASLLIPALPLALWYVYHYAHTGYVFGNPEFFRYNVAATLSLTRFLLALAMRLWQISRLSPLMGLDAGDADRDVDAAAAARFRRRAFADRHPACK